MQLKKRLLRLTASTPITITTTTTRETADLAARFGTQQRHLGSGNDGSVSAFRRASDGALFAVKQYRPRRASESKASYQATLNTEYIICRNLHHGNIIKMHDLVSEKGTWYQVMECAPFDLFAAVMQGGMSRAEQDCCFRQVVEGVTFLHGIGIAHRDLKLDNIVVTREGIMKIIDFGSAFEFYSEYKSKVVYAQGIAGSLPYLAPEVYTPRPYDARAADVWSLAVIYYTLVTRRLPWKVARISDLSYAHFVGAPNIHPERQRPIGPTTQTIKLTVRESDTVTPPSSRRASVAPLTTANGAPELPKSSTTAAVAGHSVISRLPPSSRPLMAHMFAIDPSSRANVEVMAGNPWLSDIRHCSEDASTGQTFRCAGDDEQGREGHVHTLVRANA